MIHHLFIYSLAPSQRIKKFKEEKTPKTLLETNTNDICVGMEMKQESDGLESKNIRSVGDSYQFIADFDKKYNNIFDMNARKHIERHHVNVFFQEYPEKYRCYFWSLFGLVFFCPLIYVAYYSSAENSTDKGGLLIFILVFAAIWEFLALKPIFDFRPGRQALLQCLRQANVRSGELESLFRAYKRIDESRPRRGPGGDGGGGSC